MAQRALLTTLLGGLVAVGCGGAPSPHPAGGAHHPTAHAGGASGEAPPPPVVKKEARELFESAVKAAARDPEGAIEGFKAAIKEDEALGEAYFNVGWLYAQEDKPDEAEAWYRKSASKGKKFGTGLNNLGAMKAAAGADGEAVGLFREAVRLDPLNPGANINLAHALRRQKQYAEAVKRVRTALKRNADNVQAYEALGRIYYDLGRYELAKLVCLQGIIHAKDLAKNPEQRGVLDPNPAGVHNVLGLVWMKLNDVTLALKSFESAVKADPNCVPAHLNLGAIAFGYRDYETAYRHFDKAAQLEPKNKIAILSRAVAARGLERFGEAEKGYKEVLALDPHHVGALYDMGVLYQEYTQKLDEALKAFEQVLRYETRDQALRKDVTQRIQAVRIQIQNLKEMEEMQRQDEEQSDSPAPPAGGAATDG